MKSLFKREGKVRLGIFIIVAIVLGSLLFVAASQSGLFSRSVHQSFQLAISFSVEGGQGYIVISVAQGQGQMCAQDSSSGQSSCTSNSYNFPVSVGDSVTFSATPGSGYAFNHFQAGGGAPPTSQNPVTATIVQQASGGFGYVDAYFTQSGAGMTVTSFSTQTQPPSAFTTTTTSQGSGTGGGLGIALPSTTVLIIIGVLILLVAIVVILARR